MATTLPFNKASIEKIFKATALPFKNITPYWKVLLLKLQQSTTLTFRQSGARDGNPAWPPLKKSTIATQSKTISTLKLRYGTDKKPKRTRAALLEYKKRRKLMWHRGPLPGYKGQRRYAFNSKPLMASGSFMKTFRQLLLNRERLHFGTRHELAEVIMRNRNVLFLTRGDENRAAQLLLLYYKRFWKL